MPAATLAADAGPPRGGRSAVRSLASARIVLHAAGDRAAVFAMLRDLALVPRWWPGARSVTALPAGPQGRHARALVDCGRHALELRVIDYHPPSRLLLALHGKDMPLLVSIGIASAGDGTVVELIVSAAGQGGWMRRVWHGWRVRRLAKRAGRRMQVLLGPRVGADPDGGGS
jgi:uncharacterized protein YndB with AHSA1/START domain